MKTLFSTLALILTLTACGGGDGTIDAVIGTSDMACKNANGLDVECK
jgi:hypothetical protein